MAIGAEIGKPIGVAIGHLQVDGMAMLAPMSGVSDLAMRRIARRFGAALAFSEMVAAEAFLQGDVEAAVRAEGDGVKPHAVQVVGREPAALAETARRVESAGADLIDINMGCPARRVAGALAGAALMRDLNHAEQIVETVARAVSIPVTLKMRLGWDEHSLNAPELARRAERAGARMATIHGRTRAQFYSGRADWAAARPVVEAVSMPVAINGDCANFAEARAALEASGAQAVMIGRAALGAPWIVGAIGRALAGGRFQLPSLAERADAALEHLDWLLHAFGAKSGLKHGRKHLAAYAEKAGALALRRELVTTEDPALAARLLKAAFAASETREAA